MTDEIYYSRCSVGKNKWLWVTYFLEDYFDGKEPFAFGYAATANEAEAKAIEAAKQRHPKLECRQGRANVAQFCRRRKAAKSKAARQSSSTGAAPQEFVYRDCFSDYGDDYSVRHRIVKRTRRKVFVEKDSFQENYQHYGDWQDFAYRRTVALDRLALERDGSAWSRRRRDRFYTTPREERCSSFVPDCARMLSLTTPWTADDVKRAYRTLVKAAHPDSGGSNQEFQTLHAAYSEALKLAKPVTITIG